MEERLIEELSDFFECRNRFAVCNEYVGMEASRIPEVFIEYFDSLDAEEQKQITAIIAAAALGKVAALVDYLLCLKSLLVVWLWDVGSAAGCEAGLCPAVIVEV